MPTDDVTGEAAASEPEPTTPADGLPVVGPDFIEEARGKALNEPLSAAAYHQMPVVGLGGSAGSIRALKDFFAALPADAGAAYVVILHLSPEHESTLPDLLQAATPLPVKAAEDGERLRTGHIYVIPPGRHLAMTNGHLRLFPLEPERGRRVAVDLFFRSLADTHGPQAVAVVLSGGDGDGSLGLRRIKERGGLTIAQDPDEAEHDSMPRSAIATGMVDWVLPVTEMPGRIARYHARGAGLHLPPEDGPPPTKSSLPTQHPDEAALREVLAFLQVRTGNDFSYYKRATIVRRLARRMQVNAVATLPEYLTFLRTHPGEAGALLQDLLISVTNFFRDREAFAALEAQIPTLFVGKGPNDAVRVWSAACATGEEAYSLAMLLHEYARRLDYPPMVQVFGCDLDEQAIQTARAGLYPLTITADVSQARLDRFFIREPRGYQVRRELRETVLFAQHDLLRDAPFSRMDLVSCRNLLIYLDHEAQTRALEIFHFALRSEGLLFLGTAESADEEKGLFAPLDKKHCLFVRRGSARPGLPVPGSAGTLLRSLQAQSRPAAFVPRSPTPFLSTLPPAARPTTSEERASLAELHFRLIERYAPPSLIVNAEGDIVHLSESVGRFLRPPGGQVTAGFLQLVHPGLRLDLRAAWLRMEETRAPAEIFGVEIELDGARKLVDLRVAPAAELAPGYVLVTFAARAPGDPASPASPDAAPSRDAEAVVRHLERELEDARTRLNDTVDRARASEEGYRSSNEELQSINEELRSASEELETSREELQSLNEELTTVNQELKHKVGELGHANSALHNLMNATAIATVFLDRELKVLRFTPSAVPLFNLIPSDAGRPLDDLKHRIHYPALNADAAQVLETLVPTEREIAGPDGRHFLARLLPYRLLEDQVAGVVLAFVDITERRQAEEELRVSEEQYRTLFNSIDAGFCTIEVLFDAADWAYDYRFLETNPAFVRQTGMENAVGRTMREFAPELESFWFETYGRIARTGVAERFEHRAAALDKFYDVYAFRVQAPEDNRVAVLFNDIAERKRAEAAVRAALQEAEQARGEAEAAGQAKDHFLTVLSHELRTPLTPVTMAVHLLARHPEMPASAQRALEMIERNVQIEAQFIDGLLDVTRIERGKLEIEREPTDLHEAVHRAVEIVAPDIGRKGQTVDVSLGATSHRVRGDATRLQQVFWNLLKNASKFTPEGGRLRVHSRNEPGRIVVEVSDTGIGFEPGTEARLFEAFKQASAEVTRRFGGLGLGLAIARAAVAAHDGELRAHSEGANRGATFVVDLPLLP